MRSRSVLSSLKGPRALPRAVDGVVDGGVVAFAGWTLLYECALVTGWSLWWLAGIWCVGVLAGFVFAAFRWPWASSRLRPESVRPLSRLRLPRPRLFFALFAAATIVAVFLALRLVERDLPELLALTVICVIAALALAHCHPVSVERSGSDERTWHHVVVLLCAAGFAALSLFLLHPDADDVYYVNRAVWAAEHGTAVTRDTLFSAGVYPNTYAGGVLPLASVESLDGALAHLLGVSAAGFTYLVATPVIAFLSVWIMWRLVRSWTERQSFAAFVVALSFVLYSGASIVGNYSVGRIWQGKVTAFVLLLPLVWVVATRLEDKRRRRDLAMMFSLGVAFVGLTSSATILGCALGAGLLVVSALLRSRYLAGGALLFSLAPVLSGVAVGLLSPGVGGGSATGDPLPALSGWQSFVIAVGSRPVLAGLAVLALILAPLLVRRGPASFLAAAAAMVFLGSLLPGVTDVLNAATGTGPVLWRFSLVVPLAVLVGILATSPIRVSPQLSLSDSSRVVAGFLVAVIVASGVPLWSPALSTQLTSRPTWKVDQAAQPLVARISRLDVGEGPVLLPPQEMNVLALTTTRMFAVVPRYVGVVDESPERATARGQLLALVQHRAPLLGYADTDAALSALDVSLVCVAATDRAVVRRVKAAGYHVRRHIGPLNCLVPSGGA
jgi:hypothetical protein